MFSNQASPDEVASSLQNLNLQSRPFNFADEAPSSGFKAPPPAHSAGLDNSMLPGEDNSSPPQTHDFSTAAEHNSSADPIEGATEDSMKVDIGTKQGDSQEQDSQEQTSAPVNYVSRRTTDPYMEKKLRGLQVCSGLCTHVCNLLRKVNQH